MILARKEHSEAEMERNRIAFYKRFAKIEADKEKDQPYMTYKLAYE